MVLSNLTNILISRFTRVLLVASMVHLGQIMVGCLAAVDDGSTRVGFPWIFARWGGWPYVGHCSSISYPALIATLAFWLAAACLWSYVGWWRQRPQQ